MRFITCMATVILTIHAANCYILLTANLEDVQAIAKQLAQSPVADQLTKIWRRASNQFNAHVQRARPQTQYFQKRADAKLDDDNQNQPQSQDRQRDEVADESDGGNRVVERRSQADDDDLVALGKNASLYLKSIRKIFEKVQ
ncbi:uncharacterized protein LOC126375590 [Pectinophora gossypiella]|uniref:uncharacterized protein LOC126375590 n=1 Tax=Pectinophora gossypiella TaxID=13191 RepID=UPI00214F206F|nr:uncharacterized protein LOC126375590 [Pectinophora gossypiella]